MVTILILQAITLITLLLNFATLSPYAVGSIVQLPPVDFLYFGTELSWIGAGRTIGHAITALANVLIGGMCIWYGVVRKMKLIKFLTIAMGIQFLVASVVHSAIAGAITLGGWWHLIAFAASTITAICSVLTVVLFLTIRKQLFHIGQAYDMHIDQPDTK